MMTTISGAYLEFLESYLKEWSFAMCVHVERPIKKGKLNLNREIDRAFRDFKFPPTGKEKVVRTGDWWIQDRMRAVFDEGGEYYPYLHRNRHMEYILSSLKDYRRHQHPTWNANRFVLTLFDPASDLHRSRRPAPPCLSMLSFHPKKRQKLSLVAIFRAQYVDTKAYGNILSLAELQKRVCNQTGFEAGSLHSVASKLISRHNVNTIKRLHRQLKRS